MAWSVRPLRASASRMLPAHGDLMTIVPAWLLIPAQAAPSGGGLFGGDITSMLLLFGAMGAIMYFLIWRPQQREKKERESLLSSLARGDRVVTRGGMHGKIVSVDDQQIKVEIASKTTVVMDKEAIASRVSEPSGDSDTDGKKG